MKYCIGILIILIFSGCYEKPNYEDKELTKAFVNKNKDKLKKIYEIDVYSSMSGNDDMLIVYSESFLASLSPFHSRMTYDLNGCQHIMYISSDSIEFTKNDIIKYGKEFMFEKAENCLDSILGDIDYLNYKKEQAKRALNEKFDINKVKNKE